MPASGSVEASFEEGLVDLRASAALRSEILRVLARIAGFELDVASSRIEDRALTARIEAPLFDVLALLLRGVDYELDVRFDPVSQSHRIARLRIAPRSEGPDAPLETALPDPLVSLLDSEDAAVVVAAIEALRDSRDPRAILELEPLLDDDDPAVRDAAALAIEALAGDSGPGVGMDESRAGARPRQ